VIYILSVLVFITHIVNAMNKQLELITPYLTAPNTKKRFKHTSFR